MCCIDFTLIYILRGCHLFLSYYQGIPRKSSYVRPSTWLQRRITLGKMYRLTLNIAHDNSFVYLKKSMIDFRLTISKKITCLTNFIIFSIKFAKIIKLFLVPYINSVKFCPTYILSKCSRALLIYVLLKGRTGSYAYDQYNNYYVAHTQCCIWRRVFSKMRNVNSTWRSVQWEYMKMWINNGKT